MELVGKLAHANASANLIVTAAKHITDSALLLEEGGLNVNAELVESVYYLVKAMGKIGNQISDLARSKEGEGE